MPPPPKTSEAAEQLPPAREVTRRPQPLSGPHFFVLAAVVFAVSLTKGLGLPNLWAASHLTFNYSHGFVRRGLLGEILWLTGRGWFYGYGALVFVAVLLFIATTTIGSRLIWRLVRLDSGDWGLKAVILAFAASPAVVFFAHMIGYLDYVGLLALSIFVLWSTRTRRTHAIFYAGAATSILLALIHESMVVMFTPTMLFAMVCHTIVRTGEARPGAPSRGSLLAHTVAAGLAAFVAVILICLLGTRSSTFVEALQTSIATRADFPLRTDAFETLYQPVTENLLHIMPVMFRDNPHYKSQFVHGLVVSAAGVIAMGGYGVLLIDRLGLSLGERRAVIAAFIVAMLAPFSLNFVGCDAARWNTMVFFDGLFCIAILKLFFSARAPTPAAHRVDSSPLMLTAAVAVVLGLVSSYDLFWFDRGVVHWFPFGEQFKAFISLLRDGIPQPRGP